MREDYINSDLRNLTSPMKSSLPEISFRLQPYTLNSLFSYVLTSVKQYCISALGVLSILSVLQGRSEV